MAKFKTTRQRDAAFEARLQDLGVCMLDFGGDAPAADPLVGQAAAANAALGKEQLDWYKALAAETKPQRDEAVNLSLAQARTQASTAAKQEKMADDTYQRYTDTFVPIEKKMASEALNYDTTERRSSEAAQAQADVGTAIDAGRANIAREVASRGGDVNSGNFTASLAGMGVRGAATQAAAGNQARKSVEAVGAAKLADAANFGKGVATSNATQTQLGLNAGNSAVNNVQVPGAVNGGLASGMNAATGTAMQGNSSAGQLALGQYSAHNSAQANAESSNAATLGSLGKVAGAAVSIFSDKRLKKDRKPVDTKLSLAAVRKLPVESWKYKDGNKASDGGRTHVGPMAQSVQMALGDATAPGGKTIDLISMSGHQTGAIQELAKRVMRLEDASPKKKKKRAAS